MRVKRNGVIVLGRSETRAWQSSGPDGHAFRDEVRDRVYAMLTKRPDLRSVEIYACARAGGWMADQIARREES